MEFSWKLWKVLAILNSFSTVFSDHEQCGQRIGVSGQIFGGAKTQKGDWPWLVAFVYWPEESFFCAGSLISRSHVLTGKCFALYINLSIFHKNNSNKLLH